MTTSSNDNAIGPRHSVGAAMRSFREERGLKLEDGAAVLGVSASTLSRKEWAEQSTFTAKQIGELAELYGIPASEVEALQVMAREAGVRKKRPRGEFPAFLPLRARAFLELEASLAVELRVVTLVVLPLYFQEEWYMRALWRNNGELLTEARIDELVRLRKKRQQVVHKPDAPMIRVVLHESALTLPVGSASLMSQQLTRLAEACDLSNVEIQVQPASAGAFPGMEASFYLLRLSDDPASDQVQTFGYDEAFYRDRKSETERYRVGFRRRQVAALDLQRSKALILETAAKFAAEAAGIHE